MNTKIDLQKEGLIKTNYRWFLNAIFFLILVFLLGFLLYFTREITGNDFVLCLRKTIIVACCLNVVFFLLSCTFIVIQPCIIIEQIKGVISKCNLQKRRTTRAKFKKNKEEIKKLTDENNEQKTKIEELTKIETEQKIEIENLNNNIKERVKEKLEIAKKALEKEELLKLESIRSMINVIHSDIEKRRPENGIEYTEEEIKRHVNDIINYLGMIKKAIHDFIKDNNKDNTLNKTKKTKNTLLRKFAKLILKDDQLVQEIKRLTNANSKYKENLEKIESMVNTSLSDNGKKYTKEEFKNYLEDITKLKNEINDLITIKKTEDTTQNTSKINN